MWGPKSILEFLVKRFQIMHHAKLTVQTQTSLPFLVGVMDYSNDANLITIVIARWSVNQTIGRRFRPGNNNKVNKLSSASHG